MRRIDLALERDLPSFVLAFRRETRELERRIRRRADTGRPSARLVRRLATMKAALELMESGRTAA